jgi:hypothetical protein
MAYNRIVVEASPPIADIVSTNRASNIRQSNTSCIYSIDAVYEEHHLIAGDLAAAYTSRLAWH